MTCFSRLHLGIKARNTGISPPVGTWENAWSPDGLLPSRRSTGPVSRAHGSPNGALVDRVSQSRSTRALWAEQGRFRNGSRFAPSPALRLNDQGPPDRGKTKADKPPMAPGRMPAEPLRPLRRTPSGSHATASVLVFGGLVRGSRHRGACLRGAVFRTRNGPWSRPLPPRSLPAWSNVRLPSRAVAPKREHHPTRTSRAGDEKALREVRGLVVNMAPRRQAPAVATCDRITQYNGFRRSAEARGRQTEKTSSIRG